MHLHKKYHPANWSAVVGQDKAVRRLQARADKFGWSGVAYWISGQSGTGKSTIAGLIAREVADELDVEEIDATGWTIAGLRDVERCLQFRGMTGRGGKAVIVNEAHGLRQDVIRQLLVVLDRIPKHIAWIFTTTQEAQQNLFESKEDVHPLLSRCLPLPLARRDLAKPFAERCLEIARAEGLAHTGIDLARLVRLAKDCGNNLRLMLQHVEAGILLGDLAAA